MLSMERAVGVASVDGDDVVDSAVTKQGDTDEAEAIQKQTSDCGSALTNTQPRRE